LIRLSRSTISVMAGFCPQFYENLYHSN